MNFTFFKNLPILLERARFSNYNNSSNDSVMEHFDYKENLDSSIDDEKISRTSFLRQALVCSIMWMFFFVFGLCMGAPTVFIPQIRREANSTEAVSDAMASWLTAVLGYGSIPWVLIIPIVCGLVGRKIPLIIVCVNGFAAFIVFVSSNSVTQILISEAMESVIGAALTTVSIMVITEYSSPKYRGFFLSFKSATMFWGIWVSNAIGTFFHWKYIGIVKLACSIYFLVVVFLIPESPYWLASKGRFAKCIESHRWLKGITEHSEIELKRLINSQITSATRSRPFSLFRYGSIIVKKEFYKPSLLCLLILALYSCTGKLACSFYSLDIIKKITTSDRAAYIGMLILDGVTVLGMYAGTGLSKCLNRRTLLLVSSTIGVLFLFILSIYIYFIKISFITENHYVSIFLLMSYSLGICCGPMIMATSIYAELLPLRNRTFSICLCSFFDKFMMGTTVKMTPYVIQKLGLEVAFLIFGFSSTICIVLLYKYLPETKDKTLQEIADIMTGIIKVEKVQGEYNENERSRFV